MNVYDIVKDDFINGELRFKHPFHMYDAIHDIPGCLEACLSDEMIAKCDEFMKGKTFKNVFFVGCGTSLNSGMIAAAAVRELFRIPTFAKNGFDFMEEDMVEFSSESLVICSSHSGNTVPTCFAKDKAKKAGCTVISVIGNPGTKLAEGADLVIVDPYEKENVYGKTRSYLSAALLETLPVIVTRPAEEREAALADARQMVRDIAGSMAGWDEQITALAHDWGHRINRFMLAGMGILSVNAIEISLKILEVLTEPAIGFGLEESIHGPVAAYWPNTGVVLFHADDRVTWRTRDIDNAVNASLASDLIITTDPDAGWNEKAAVISIPKAKPAWAVYASAVVGQLLVYYMAVEKGYVTDINGKDRNPKTIDSRVFLKFSPRDK